MRRDGLAFASAVAAHCGQAYGERPAAAGHAPLEVRGEDYTRFLAASRSFDADQGPENLGALLGELDAIEASSPCFVDALLLDAAVSRYVFATSREDRYYERGLDRLAKALDLSPGEDRAYTRQFALHFEAGRLEAAIQSADALAASSPGNPQLPQLRGRLAQRAGEFARALELLAESVERQPTVANLVEYAQLQYSQNLFEPASRTLERNLADSIAAQGRLQDSQPYYRRVVAYFEGRDGELDWSDRLVLAQCEAQLGDGASAVANTQLALQTGAGEAEAYFMASLVYCLTDARVPALVNAKEAIRLGYSPRWFDLPWFESLRDDEQFARLTTPTG